jgi:hypothetical protein
MIVMRHLFYIEAEVNPDPFESTVRAYLVSAEGESQDGAEASARVAVESAIRGGPLATPCGINLSRFVSLVDRDVFGSLGELVS